MRKLLASSLTAIQSSSTLKLDTEAMICLQLSWDDNGDHCDGVASARYAPSCEFITPLSSICYYTALRRGISAGHSRPACMTSSPTTSVQSSGYTVPVLCPLRISSVMHGQWNNFCSCDDLWISLRILSTIWKLAADYEEAGRTSSTRSPRKLIRCLWMFLWSARIVGAGGTRWFS